MHEMAYVRNVVDVVNDYADREGVAEVKAVYLTIGMARDIVEDYFQGLFQYLARGTVAERAEVVIRRVPFTVRCNRCGRVFPLNVHDPKTWTCPFCGAEQDYRLNSGMEFTVDRIEVAAHRGAPSDGCGGGVGAALGAEGLSCGCAG